MLLLSVGVGCLSKRLICQQVLHAYRPGRGQLLSKASLFSIENLEAPIHRFFGMRSYLLRNDRRVVPRSNPSIMVWSCSVGSAVYVLADEAIGRRDL